MEIAFRTTGSSPALSVTGSPQALGGEMPPLLPRSFAKFEATGSKRDWSGAGSGGHRGVRQGAAPPRSPANPCDDIDC